MVSKLFKLIKKLVVFCIVVFAGIFVYYFLFDEDVDSDVNAMLASNTTDDSDYVTSSSNSNGNYDVYSDSDSYSDDSWSVLDYLFSFVGDDYGYNSGNSNSNNYSGSNDSDEDYVVDEESYEDYEEEKPETTIVASNPQTASTQDTTPVSVSKQRKSFIEYALSLKGTPYVYGGKTPSPGLDCSGFVAFAARKAITVNFTGNAQTMYNNSKSINMSSAEPGDLLFFSDTGNGITHVGIFLGKNSGQGNNDQRLFVHSASGGSTTGVIVSSIDQSNYWSKHLVGAKSFLNSTSEVRSINRSMTRSGNKKSTSTSQASDFKNDQWWDDVDASWFE